MNKSTYLHRSINFICLCLLFLSVVINAQSESLSAQSDTLHVGLAGSEPFVFISNADEKGIAVDIWEALANKKNWGYRYVYYENVEAALSSLHKKNLDVVIGPISITADRIEKSRFSQPFYNTSLAIVSRVDTLNLWDRIKPLFSMKLLMAILLFLIILAIVGTLLWLAERRRSPDQFPVDPLSGIGDGMWLAIVTMTTVGYGDKAPTTLLGRIIAGSWMVISIIFATSMVAGIASVLTLSSLDSSTVSNIEQLAGRKAATISNSPSENFLRENRVKIIGVNSLDEAIIKLKNKEVNAVIYDRPQLLYYLNKNQDENLYIAKAAYYKQGYGFAFPLQTTLVYDVNRVLLELAEEQEVQGIIDNYLEKDE